MKKFILALTAVAVTSLAGAATVGWSLAGAGNYANDAYQIFVIGQKGIPTTDAIKFITDKLDAGTDVSSYAFGSGTVNGSGAANRAATATGAPTLDAGTYTAFYVIYDSATPAAGSANYAVVSGASTLTQTFAATKASVTFVAGNQGNYLNNTDNWKSFGPVPEPTTVALLALGLAAVGLKRKVA